MNIYGDYNEREYLYKNDKNYKDKANKTFIITIFVTFLIYIYFVVRNYNAYKNASLQDKQLYAIKLLGSSLLIAGAICLLYFQVKQTSFTGTPAI